VKGDGIAQRPLVACEGPVGIGKTTAVMAYLLRRAITTGARRLIIVAPYTAILSQTADRLRRAVVLPDERDRAEEIVAEHHHRADFGSISSRDLATLWRAPVVLTTAVQFFETLASNEPSTLRKLHALPGSAVFLDEAHAALPAHLWAQNWRWLQELAEDWSCSFVLASGSLARFWEVEDIVGDAKLTLPELVPAGQTERLRIAESERVHYVAEPRFDGPGPLADAVTAAPGPRLLIMNTLQSAAVMARHMRSAGHDTLHLSTALCPRDRNAILEMVRGRLDPEEGYPSDWTLVATSLMEAGVDLSFRTPFRERFATASLIQIGGRGNRNFEWSEGVTVHDFAVSHVDGLVLQCNGSSRWAILAQTSPPQLDTVAQGPNGSQIQFGVLEQALEIPDLGRA
jgi:CRISPR-associated endonuclease/helicase Cas3